MTGIDILTRDTANMPGGIDWATYSWRKWEADTPVSGDELARMRAEDGLRAR